MNDFNRESRYIVIKRSDLAKVPVNYRRALVDPLGHLQAHLPRRECLVIESDWPEYEAAWRMIEARMTGTQPAEAEGVEVVAWRYTSSQAFGRRDRRWHYQETFPEAGARQVQEIGQLDALVRESDHLDALSAERTRADVAVADANDAERALAAVTAERDALREQVKALQSDANSWQSGYDKGRHDGTKHRKSEIDQLRAEVETLRKDAERYRWLRDPCSGAEHVIYYSRGDYGRGLMSGSMLDAAIDAAMAAKEALE